MSAKARVRESLLRQLTVPFGAVCWYCGLDLRYQIKHIDHILPKSLGGSDDLDNLALTCSFCNYAKHDRTIDEFYAWLGQVREQQSHFNPTVSVHPVNRSLYSRWQHEWLK